MKHKTATFIGHRDCFGISSDLVKSSIERLLEQGVTDFLNGGMGSFDWLCARAVYELKISSHPEIRNYLVIPYLSFSIREKSILTIYFTPRDSKNTISNQRYQRAIVIWWNIRLTLSAMLITVGVALQRPTGVLRSRVWRSLILQNVGSNRIVGAFTTLSQFYPQQILNF